MDTEVIYCDDNLPRLAHLPSNSVDLIYLDPPFFSNRHYEVIWGDEAEVRSFEDRWEGGIYHYIAWMKDRVMEMWRVLKPTGSLYLHCDWHASHYIKVMLDETLGDEHFQNEIIWHYQTGGASRSRFSRKHDTIFWYTKGKKWKFYGERIAIPRTEKSMARAQNPQGARIAADDTMKNPNDVLIIQQMNPMARERLGYPTQKPEALLEQFILSGSDEGDIVLDPFAGCGTTLVVAQRHKRHWVGIDISPTACNLMKRQLIKAGAAEVKLIGMPTTLADLAALKPFEFQNWIVDRINGIQANRKSGDMGIDGWTFMIHDPVQIKQSESVGRNVIDNFETAISRAGKVKGFIIAFSFTKGAYEEVARVGKGKSLEIHLVQVADLLERPDKVFSLMGVDTGLPGLGDAPFPTIESGRRSAEELINSERPPDDKPV